MCTYIHIYIHIPIGNKEKMNHCYEKKKRGKMNSLPKLNVEVGVGTFFVTDRYCCYLLINRYGIHTAR